MVGKNLVFRYDDLDEIIPSFPGTLQKPRSIARGVGNTGYTLRAKLLAEIQERRVHPIPEVVVGPAIATEIYLVLTLARRHRHYGCG
jgi:hypothetical protein